MRHGLAEMRHGLAETTMNGRNDIATEMVVWLIGLAICFPATGEVA